MVKKIVDFVTHDIWNKNEQDYRSGKARWAVRQAKVLILTAKGFGEHNLVVRSSALTFYTLMSLVPIAALIFAIVKGFGFQTNFNDYLYLNYPQYSSVIDMVLSFADNMLERTKGGLIAAVGFVVLFWALMQVFGNIESAFNYIWEVKRPRSVARKFSDYLTMVFIAPILWVLSNSFSLYVRANLSYLSQHFYIELLYNVASLATLWVMFTFIYFVMPNTKVRLKNAFMAGVVAGTLFAIFQVGYFYIQTQVSSYNAIYGSFAALPLFLIWLQASWQIMLFGAELSFAYQHIGKYEQERQVAGMSRYTHLKVLIATMIVIARHFVNNQGGVTSEVIAEELNQPLRIVRDVLYDLENCNIIVSVQNDKQNTYLPAKDIHNLTVCDVIAAVECDGTDSLYQDTEGSIERVESILSAMSDDARRSKYNVPLIDLV